MCKILTQVCKKNGVLSLAKDLSPDEYRIFRVKLIEIIEQGMKRKLDLWEKEIILYPRLCRQCHSENVLIHCPECKMDFYCSKDHQQDHNQWCNQFKLFQRIIYLQKYHGSVTPKLPNRIHKVFIEIKFNSNSEITKIKHSIFSLFFRKQIPYHNPWTI